MITHEKPILYKLIFPAFFLFLLVLQGCAATTKITSKKSDIYNKKTERVFILSNISTSLGDKFAKDFGQSIFSGFYSYRVDAEVATVLELDLDINIHKKRMAEFYSDSILIIKDIEKTVNERYIIMHMKFDVILMDNSENIKWRSKVDFYPNDLGKDDADVLAKDILTALKKDDLI